MQWMMLQQEKPDDFVIATGKQHSVREFVEKAAYEIGIRIRWNGEGISEKGYNADSGECIVAIDPRYFRPAEVDTLLGDPSKAKKVLGWEPKITFENLVIEMMREDMRLAERDVLIKKNGYQYYDQLELV
jgi:GDPmannose 4,6-dehydratase